MLKLLFVYSMIQKLKNRNNIHQRDESNLRHLNHTSNDILFI